MKQDQRIVELLRERAAVPENCGLAERIVTAAAQIEQKDDIKLFSWLRQLFVDYTSLKPAYVLSSILLVGFLTGFAVPLSEADSYEMYGLGFGEFLYEEEVIL